jgi:hypothetical protein
VKKIAVIMNVVSNTALTLSLRCYQGILEAGKDPAQTIAVLEFPGHGKKKDLKSLIGTV